MGGYDYEQRKIVYDVDDELGTPQTLEERIADVATGAVHTEDDVVRVAQRIREADWETLIRAEAMRKSRRWQLIQERSQALMEQWSLTQTGWCQSCQKPVKLADLVSITDESDNVVIKSSEKSVCVECRKKIRARHQKTCPLCGVIFMTEYADAASSLCGMCATPDNTREDKRVRNHCWRASHDGLPASLTLPEWLQTLADFGNLCAYCQTEPYSDLEHFIPIRAGGGTTVNNCVPACSTCNTRKNKRHPDAGTLAHIFARGEIERVRIYLASR